MSVATSAPSSDVCTYEKFNETTHCWKPRSCADCLRQEGCMINSAGLCQSLLGGTVKPERDFKRAFELNLTLPAAKDTMNTTRRRMIQSWAFPAAEATYCSSDDAVCRQCAQERFWLPIDGGVPDSRFCVGANGCVCVLNCEVSMVAPVCTDRPKDAETVVTPTPTPLSTSPPLAEMPAADECRYTGQDSGRRCPPFRSCRDCLLKPGCRIATDGYCEADRDSYSLVDFRKAINDSLSLPGAKNAWTLDGKQSWVFPATRATYCAANDTVCSDCQQHRYWLGERSSDSRFCVGADGCVCVANCARDDDTPSCSLVEDTPADSSGSVVAIGAVINVAVFVGAVVLLVGLFIAVRSALRQRNANALTARSADGGEPTPPVYETVHSSPRERGNC